MALIFKGKKLNSPAPPEESHEKNSSCNSSKFKESKMRYPKTYNSWRNMKARVKDKEHVHESIRSFIGFLEHLGPCEKQGYTLDRINNEDPEYAPGKVRWASKKTQNSNKSDNIFVTYEGERQTIAQWAEDLGIPKSTLYNRKKQGWTDTEIIEGQKGVDAPPSIDDPLPPGWEQGYVDYIAKRGYLSKFDYMLLRAKHQKAKAEEEGTDLTYTLKNFEMYGEDEAEVAKVKEALKRNNWKYEQCHKIITEVEQQLRYEEKRDYYFDNLAGKGLPPNIRKAEKAKFDESHPRPKYTINTPQFETRYPGDPPVQG